MNIEKTKEQFLELIKTLIASIVAAFLITRLVSPVIIQGSSMVPTFSHGERYFVNRLVYTNTSPEKNDIIVFKTHHGKIYLIKRVIAVEGDIVSIKNNQLYVNNEKVNEPYIKEPRDTPDIDEIHLKNGEVFVMGDNRNNSSDSRHFGTIKEELILGRLITFKKTKN